MKENTSQSSNISLKEIRVDVFSFIFHSIIRTFIIERTFYLQKVGALKKIKLFYYTILNTQQYEKKNHVRVLFELLENASFVYNSMENGAAEGRYNIHFEALKGLSLKTHHILYLYLYFPLFPGQKRTLRLFQKLFTNSM